MDEIRPFRNADLPDIADIWIRHWATVTQPPPVSVAMIEQAVFARTFFQANDLLIARRNNATVAWCHMIPDTTTGAAVVPAICFAAEGLQLCDALLRQAEAKIFSSGCQTIEIGPLRDSHCGYAGLAPLGHGIGVSTTDTRTSSLLSRQGYSTGRTIQRLVAETSTYRPAVNREWMQYRRTTRIERRIETPTDSRTASAMAHLDIERYSLIDHRSGKELATVDLWTSDPEAQVMSCAEAILDLGPIQVRGELTSEEGFLISSLIQSLANRRVFEVQTALDDAGNKLQEQLALVGMKSVERGHRWTKQLP